MDPDSPNRRLPGASESPPGTSLPSPDGGGAPGTGATAKGEMPTAGTRPPSPQSAAAATTSTSPAASASGPGPGPAPKGEPILRTDGLVKVYDGRAVVNGVDIQVAPGEIVGLLGPNGAGKTTTFYMIAGLVPPNDGRVFFHDEDVTRMAMFKRARRGMGYLPQEESIFRKLTVRDNIMAVMETTRMGRKERNQRCDALLEQFGISHIAKNEALTLSGGEKRRLTIARSLVSEPSLLMLDEPFSGVDPIAVEEIQDIVTTLRKAGLAILITDHNVRETLSITDRAYLIFEGEVMRQGTREFLINDPMSRELYLGERFSM